MKSETLDAWYKQLGKLASHLVNLSRQTDEYSIWLREELDEEVKDICRIMKDIHQEYLDAIRKENP